MSPSVFGLSLLSSAPSSSWRLKMPCWTSWRRKGGRALSKCPREDRCGPSPWIPKDHQPQFDKDQFVTNFKTSFNIYHIEQKDKPPHGDELPLEFLVTEVKFPDLLEESDVHRVLLHRQQEAALCHIPVTWAFASSQFFSWFFTDGAVIF